LDRLIDHDPGNRREPPRGPLQIVKELKQAVRRDLENLLNTRWRCKAWPPNMDELDVSLVNYGIPDFTGANLAVAPAREEFRRIIELVIRRYEPRFKSVRVELVENSDETDRTMRFRIDAVLFAEPEPEPVVFDSVLEPTTSSFEITRSSR